MATELVTRYATPRKLSTRVGQLGYYTHWQDPALADALQLGVRFYEPGVGRFDSLDPLRDGVNYYVYGDGNPTLMVDPDGRFAFAIPIVACGLSVAEAAALAASIAAIVCGSDEDCRQAVMAAIESLAERLSSAARAAGRCCCKALRLRCELRPWEWKHKKRHPYMINGKKC